MPCVPSGVSHFFYLDLLSFSSSRKTGVGLVWRTCTSLGNGVTQETRVCKDGIVLGPMWLALGLWLWRKGSNTLEERRNHTDLHYVCSGEQVVAVEISGDDGDLWCREGDR